MDDLLDRYDFGQQLLQKSQERFYQRKHSRISKSTSTSDESKMNSKQKATRSDSDDEDDRAKRSKLNHNRNKEQLKCPPSAPKATTAMGNQKRPPQNSVDEEEKAKLRACFSSSDSDDDDPVAAIKRRQIAERRMKGWKLLPEKRVDIESTGPKHLAKMNDGSVTDAPEENVDTATEQSPAASSFKQPSEEHDALPPSPALETKMITAENSVSKSEDVNEGNDAEMMMEDAIPTPKSSPTKSAKESPMKCNDVMKTDDDTCNNEEMTSTDSAFKNASPAVKQTTAMMKVDDDEDNEPVSLTIVSWNINEAKCSNVAPDPALRTREAPRLIREEILRSEPDVIALQESPNPLFGTEKFAGYVSVAGTAQSHSGHVDLLVKRELASDAKQISLQHTPAVAATLTLQNRTRIAIASLHLAPSKELAAERIRECESIMKKLTSRAQGVILAGDFNMLQSEDKITEKLCGGNWVDAWKEATNSNPKKKFTWNTAENKYFDNPPRTIRFDRCYGRGEKLRVTHFDLIGNQPVDEMKGDYLSDHYGIVAKYEVKSSDSPLVNDATSSDDVTSALYNTTSNSAASGSKDGSNAAALRAARLHKYENAASFGATEPTKKHTKQKEEVIELLDSDDVDINNCATSNSLESDRALAERLQWEEEKNAHHSFAESSASQVDYSSVRPGVLGSLRDKHAALQPEDTAQLSASRNGVFATHIRAGILSDTHPQAWSSGGWVWVKNPQYANGSKARVDSKDDVALMSTEWNSLKKSNVKITHRHLIDLATKHNVLHGKWLLNIKADCVQTDWPKVRNAIIEGKLGLVAKISDAPDKRGHVVCIYCPNALDKDEVLRIRRAIRNDVGLERNSILRFKLDAVTNANIYAYNSALRTTSYDCGGKDDEECSTLISHWEQCTMIEGCKRCYPCCLGRKPKNENTFFITGLKYAEATAAQGEKVTLLREPENVSLRQLFNNLNLPFLSMSLLIQLFTLF